MRWAVLGPGGMAEKAFVPTVRGAGHVLEAVDSHDPARARAFAEAHGANRTGTYDEVLADDRIDAVYSALPNDRQFAHATAGGPHPLPAAGAVGPAQGLALIQAAVVDAPRLDTDR